MKKVLLSCFTLVIAFVMVGCSTGFHDIKTRLNEGWNVQLPSSTEEIYNCYEPTFTGLANQYVVLTCDDAAIKELKASFTFILKDKYSTENLESFFEKMEIRGKYKIDDAYIIDLSENYVYYAINNIVWLILSESSKELIVCIVGH